MDDYIVSLESEIQQIAAASKAKYEANNREFRDEYFLSGCKIGLLLEEQEMWKKQLKN